MISLETRTALYGAWLALKAARKAKANTSETLEIVALGVLVARRRLSPTARIILGQLTAAVGRAKVNAERRAAYSSVTINGKLWWQS